MEHPLPSPEALVRPWRTATLVASAVAALELVVLVAAGAVLLAKPLSAQMRRSAQVRAFAPAKKSLPKKALVQAAGKPKLPRARTKVIVLNGNGRSGAAAAEAATVTMLGYKIRSTGNAPRSDYATSVVMYRPGFRADAQRLARSLRVKVVGPLDGLSVRSLHGAHLAIILGAA